MEFKWGFMDRTGDGNIMQQYIVAGPWMPDDIEATLGIVGEGDEWGLVYGDGVPFDEREFETAQEARDAAEEAMCDRAKEKDA